MDPSSRTRLHVGPVDDDQDELTVFRQAHPRKPA
jgi:hypothetical protein